MAESPVSDYILAYTNWILDNMKMDGYPIQEHKWDGKVLKIILNDDDHKDDLLDTIRKKCEGKLDGIDIEIVQP